jgi:demethylmenaquinone methyltransferase/2-methoxy-6-polyprenyl-1,4-benzoquinol methylase/phosphoethanolamine N-methyltransferase
MDGHAQGVQTEGHLIRWPRLYDLFVKVASLGGEARIRARIIAAGELEPGRRALDVGCGTGTLALAAADAVGPTGRVCGIDPAAEMVAAARAKAARRGVEVAFSVGVIESLDFPDRSMDVVFSTFMFHHLPPPLRLAGLREVRRVLAPGGRLVLVDFGKPGRLVDDAKGAGFASVRMAPMKPRIAFLMVSELADAA